MVATKPYLHAECSLVVKIQSTFSKYLHLFASRRTHYLSETRMLIGALNAVNLFFGQLDIVYLFDLASLVF
jgi:hypothetical protein